MSTILAIMQNTPTLTRGTRIRVTTHNGGALEGVLLSNLNLAGLGYGATNITLRVESLSAPLSYTVALTGDRVRELEEVVAP